MTSNPIDIGRALDFLGALRGEYVWGPERLEGDILSLQFGAPHLKVYNPLHMPAGPGVGGGHALSRYVGAKGRWNLFIEGGFWTVTANGFRTFQGHPLT